MEAKYENIGEIVNAYINEIPIFNPHITISDKVGLTIAGSMTDYDKRDRISAFASESLNLEKKLLERTDKEINRLAVWYDKGTRVAVAEYLEGKCVLTVIADSTLSLDEILRLNNKYKGTIIDMLGIAEVKEEVLTGVAPETEKKSQVSGFGSYDSQI